MDYQFIDKLLLRAVRAKPSPILSPQPNPPAKPGLPELMAIRLYF